MFFGRVDIYWPDGPIESHRLEKPTVAIGRSTGNDIALDTTTVSRYHVTITYKNQQVLLEDLESANGTYVDGVRLVANQPHLLRGGEEIQIGDIRLLFHPAVELGETAGATTQITKLAQPTYRIEYEGPDMGVAPGAHIQAVLGIENIGEETDRYTVEIDGLPKGWVRMDRTELSLKAGETAQVVISFKPLRRSETQPIKYPFVIHVRSKTETNQTIDVPASLHVLPYCGFGMALGNDRVSTDGHFVLYVHNQGNAPLPISVQGADPSRRLRFRFPQMAYTLAPGERQTVHGHVRLRHRQLFGQSGTHEFAFVVRSRDAARFLASVPGTYMENGLFPGWMPVIAVPILAVMILLLVGVLLTLGGDGEKEDGGALPVIGAFAASRAVIAVDEPTSLAWNVMDADSVDLSIERDGTQQPVSLEADSSSYSAVFDQTGHYNFVLTAQNGDQVVTQMLTVEVIPAVVLRLEIVGAAELVRFVERDIHAEWDVRGAVEMEGGYNIWLESSDPGGALASAPQPLSAAQEFVVVAGEGQSEWMVTLYAEGRDNTVASVTQKLTVAYPSCELKAARTLVRGGPGETYAAIVPPLESSAEGNPSLSPVARDPSGEWLRVVIGVDNARAGWVRQRDFVCTNFDPAQLVVSTDYPPPPPATPDGGDEGTGESDFGTMMAPTQTPVVSMTVPPRNTSSE